MGRKVKRYENICLHSRAASRPDHAVGDACAFVPAEWHSFIKAATYHPDLQPYVGRTMNVTGSDQVTAVLENDQWKLCGSDWDQTAATFTSRDGRSVQATGIRFKK